MNTFGEKLESLRNGMTQKEFAASLHTPINTYTNWVRGLREPSMSAIVSLCTQLSVSADWLLGISPSKVTAATFDHSPPSEAAPETAAVARVDGASIGRDCLECPLLQAHLKRFSRPRK